MSKEREIAVRGLMEIFASGAYSNLAIRRILASHADLSRVQKAFITEIVIGCIRNLIQLDCIIDDISSVHSTKMKPAVLNILRISVYQMKFMDKVPVFAICNEATNLVKKMGFARLSGFVNGVLRNIHRNIDDLPRLRSDDAIERAVVEFSCARWIVEQLVDELGLDTAREVLSASQMQPKMTLCVNARRARKDKLRDILLTEGLDVADGNLHGNCLIVSKTSDITSLLSYAEGLYHVMDEAAALAVKCAVPTTGRVIDLCAAPGGKSFAVASNCDTISILARDIYAHKLKLIKEGATRLGHSNIEVKLGDATQFDNFLRQTADLVIADVPCSGLGTLAKRPDIKLEARKSKDDVTDLAALQRRILGASWDYVKPGGRLLYSTCTISNAENIDNRNWFLTNYPFKPVDIRQHMPDFPGFESARDGYIQILPHHFGTDGFFIAVFERVGEDEEI